MISFTWESVSSLVLQFTKTILSLLKATFMEPCRPFVRFVQSVLRCDLQTTDSSNGPYSHSSHFVSRDQSFTARSRVVKQSFFSLSGQYGCRVNKAHGKYNF